jgi:hypothetical protein
MPAKPIIFTPPNSAAEIEQLANRAIRRAGAIGVLPTPIDDLFAAADIADKSDGDNSILNFLSTLDERARSLFKTAISKVRGIADMRERAVYIPTDTPHRQFFVKAHELGHQDLPWHKTFSDNNFFHDDNQTLSPEIEDLFEREANYYAGKIIYQGKNFIRRARSYKPSFEAVFSLADQHGASKQATLTEFVEVQDETIAAITYLPSKFKTNPQSGMPVLNAPRIFSSDKFFRKYENLELPLELAEDHPWVKAQNSIEIPSDYINLVCDGITVNFWWQAWWNNYALLVLLKREPKLSFLGRVIRI